MNFVCILVSTTNQSDDISRIVNYWRSAATVEVFITRMVNSQFEYMILAFCFNVLQAILDHVVSKESCGIDDFRHYLTTKAILNTILWSRYFGVVMLFALHANSNVGG